MNSNLIFKSKFTLYDFLSKLENDEVVVKVETQSRFGGTPIKTHIGDYHFKKEEGCQKIKALTSPHNIKEIDTKNFIIESYTITLKNANPLEILLSIIIQDNPETVERAQLK